MTTNSGKVLFRLPIAATKGEIVCTERQPQVYLITFTSPADNRLLTDFCHALLLAFDILEIKHEPGVVITTSGIPKFYSNGLDLGHAINTPNYWGESLYALWRRVLTYPMPTIALINGHAFAGGAMLAMMHDYRFMNPEKGYFCLNEVELGAPLRLPMTSIFRQKVRPQAYRLLVLEAARLKASEAIDEGIVDALGNLDSVLQFVEQRKLVAKAQPGMSGLSVYRSLKVGMWAETVRYLDASAEEEKTSQRAQEIDEVEFEAINKRVAQWESKPKL